MVAIVSGNSLGLSLGSMATLGQRGVWGEATQGRSGERAYVNAATGNLVLQTRDEYVAGSGQDLVSVRTYNSQGLLDDDNGDNWALGVYRRQVELNGTLNTAGSTLTRTSSDGARAVYQWDAIGERYASTAGAGAYDFIVHDSAVGEYQWTDGDSATKERYDALNGRLKSSIDVLGSTLTYVWSAEGRLTQVTDGTGASTSFEYAGDQLTRVIANVPGVGTASRVHYDYDGSYRLSRVTVDGPTGSYVTNYTYDGISRRVSSVAQSDGTSLHIVYAEVDGAYRVASIRDALNHTTSYSYNTAQRLTTVVDAEGLVSTFQYDAKGQLIEMRQGVTSARPKGLNQLSFVYNTRGDVLRVNDGFGCSVAYEYDANGNQTRQIDAAGNTMVRAYDARNRLTAVHASTEGGSISSVVTVSVVASTTTTLRPSVVQAYPGQSIALFASVAGAVSGSVRFYNGSVLIGTGALVNGLASFTTSSLAPGAAHLTAVYDGDADRVGSTSATALVQVDSNLAPSNVTLTTSTARIPQGQVLVLRASVAAGVGGAGTVSGMVSFYNGSTLLGTSALVGGIASLSTNVLVQGTARITAVYEGGTGLVGSLSQQLDVEIIATLAASTVALSGVPAQVIEGQSPAVVVTVSGVANAAGTVAIYSGTQLLAMGTVANGQATLNLQGLAPGTANLKAIYFGSDVAAGAISSPVALLVKPLQGALTTTTLTVSSTQAAQSTYITYSVAIAGGSTPSGTVLLYNGNTCFGSATVVNGVAELRTNVLPEGAAAVRAVYQGDALLQGSTSSVVNINVGQAPVSRPSGCQTILWSRSTSLVGHRRHKMVSLRRSESRHERPNGLLSRIGTTRSPSRCQTRPSGYRSASSCSMVRLIRSTSSNKCQ